MAHRGRLNVLANVVGKSYAQIFREFEGELDPSEHAGLGRREVPPRRGRQAPVARRAAEVALTLAANPSHLEAVDPVVEGMARGQAGPRRDDAEHDRVLPVLIHGDAAFAGQGVVAETLNLSEVPGYDVGGTVHVVVNNQLGFTTAPELRAFDRVRHRRRQDGAGADLPRERRRPRGRGARDAARVRVPAGVQEGRRRRHGLLPALRPQRRRRARVHAAADVRADRRAPLGAQALHRDARATGATSRSTRRAGARATSRPGSTRRSRRRTPAARGRRRRRSPRLSSDDDDVPPSTTRSPPGAARRARRRSSTRSSRCARGLRRCNPKLERQLAARRTMFDDGRDRLGARRGARVRLARARRHAGAPRRPGHAARARSASATPCSSTTRTEAEYVPLAHLADDQAPFMLYDSVLSEFAALGFEYGYSVADRDALVCWEAQFGDFANGAQIDHRPVHRRRRGQVGPAQRPRACCCPTASKARARSTRSAAHRALPRAVRRGQPPRRLPDHRGAVLPRAAPPGARPRSASR